MLAALLHCMVSCETGLAASSDQCSLFMTASQEVVVGPFRGRVPPQQVCVMSASMNCDKCSGRVHIEDGNPIE